MERIRLDRLTKIYDREPVVANFSLSVEPGEFCVILGPSGSGKTTIMNMVCGFTFPNSGEVYVDGEPITGLAPYQRNLGMMFQGYALFPHLTVFENVAFPLRARGADNHELRSKVDQMLEIVELSGLAQRLPNELSGGQQQRTALARGLVFGPRLLLMDEPLAALDRRLRERMQSEIRAIQRKLKITVLYITHDQQEAMTLADKVVVMNKGQIEQVGEPLDVYRHPRTRFVSEFLGDTNILDVTVESIDRETAICRTPEGTRIEVSIAAPIAIGQCLAVAVRPERVRFSIDGKPKANQLTGRIGDIVDLGVTRRYRVDLPGTGKSILISEQGGPNQCGLKVGDELVFAFDKDDAVLVSR